MPDRSTDFQVFRDQHPRFVYEAFEIQRDGDDLIIEYRFLLEPSLRLRPQLKFLKLGQKELPKGILENLVFNLGMIELLSYWKAACPPEITVLAGNLVPEQIEWWKKVYYHGLGEFFFSNQLQPDFQEFVKIRAEGPAHERKSIPNLRGSLIPVGGGKDSLVTLELLQEEAGQNSIMILNPTKAQWQSAAVMGYSGDQILVVERTLSREIFALNQAGYLNGHTPFSALLGFVSALAGILHGRKNLVLSNESSADESTVPNSSINHQWSKGTVFERMLRDYLQKWIVPEVEYYSRLRTWNELQIAARFSKNKPGLGIFRSCNVGRAADTNCGRCSKCLFVNMMLAPFLNKTEILGIFGGTEPLDNEGLITEFLQLIGAAPTKPFECVGTIEEVRAALSMILARTEGRPRLVQTFADEYGHLTVPPAEVARLLSS